MWRTDEKEKQVAEKLSDLYGELREVQQRFHRELRDLEDKRITLQAELEACTEGQELIALAEDWSERSTETPIHTSPVLLSMSSISGGNVDGAIIQISFPLPDERLFRNQATEDILMLLVRNPGQEFTVTQLRTVTGHGGDTVTTALTVLEAADLIETRREGNKRLISANRSRIQNPADPVTRIPQHTFQQPVEAFLETLDDSPVNPVGVILFGSVARGDADRTSDIDLMIIVETDVTIARRELTEVRQTVEQQRFDGDRYEFQLLVEAAESVENYGRKLHEIFSEGIVLQKSERLQELKQVVFNAE